MQNIFSKDVILECLDKETLGFILENSINNKMLRDFGEFYFIHDLSLDRIEVLCQLSREQANEYALRLNMIFGRSILKLLNEDPNIAKSFKNILFPNDPTANLKASLVF